MTLTKTQLFSTTATVDSSYFFVSINSLKVSLCAGLAFPWECILHLRPQMFLTKSSKSAWTQSWFVPRWVYNCPHATVLLFTQDQGRTPVQTHNSRRDSSSLPTCLFGCIYTIDQTPLKRSRLHKINRDSNQKLYQETDLSGGEQPDGKQRLIMELKWARF